MTKKGFTLIELMIVVAIIAIIAAIAIPNLLASRKAANETSAIGTLRAIFSAEEQFRILKKLSNGGYGDLTELSNNGLFTAVGEGGLKAGYIYNLNLTPIGTPPINIQYNCIASPQSADEGGRIFGVFQTGAITYETGAVPTLTSTAID